MLSRKNLNRSSSIKNFTFKQLYKADWGVEREFPKIEENHSINYGAKSLEAFKINKNLYF